MIWQPWIALYGLGYDKNNHANLLEKRMWANGNKSARVNKQIRPLYTYVHTPMTYN